MSFKQVSPSEVAANRERYLRKSGFSLDRVVAGELVHGRSVAIVDARHCGRGARERDWLPGIDGLVTSHPGVLLLTTHADCPPLLLYEPKSRTLGQAHAGWRGLAAGIIESLVHTFLSCSQTSAADVFAWIGPSIHVCCYRVGLEVASRFPALCLVKSNDSVFLDLPRFIISELCRLGLARDHITDSGVCTCCNPKYSSFRREGEAFAAMACVSGLKGQ